MSKAQESVNIAIIGAGVGGLTTAITIQNKLGLYDYTIYDLASDVGGTWRQNNYPGCACDVPAHWYSLSTDPNPDWTCLFAPQEEIFTYWKRLAHKHKIEPHIQFNTELISAVWDEKEQNYTLNLRDVKTQKVRQVTAKIVISAVGVFRHARWPDIPGRKMFQGDILHAQMWDHNVSLRGKRVALIGNGCAGSQILPAISEDHSTTVVHFCRTPSWYAPRPQKQVPEWMRWTFQHVPFLLRMFRYLIATGSLITYIKQSTPEKYHEHLIPKYPFGCKRAIADPGYLDALNRPNVGMQWDPISEITSDGIRTKSGNEYQFDVIAFATGFDVEGSLTLDVTGVNGLRLQDYYDSQGGPTGYMGTTIPGFPNWITIFGPNTATGHASVIFAEELQMDYAIQLFKPILQGKASSFMPRGEPTQAWNERIQSGLKRHVWPNCNSWYRAAGTDGKIIALWPGSNSHMWWAFRKPNWSHFKFETADGKEWLRGPRIFDILSILVAGIGALALAKRGEWHEVIRLPKLVLKQGLDSCRTILS